MKKFLLGSLFLLSVLFVSCSYESTDRPFNPDHRFQVTYTQFHNGLYMRVVLDKQTGEQYFLVGNGSGYGLTKL